MLRSILFDFDGVLSKGRFYATIPDKFKEVKEKLERAIFSKEKPDVIQKWMKGEYSYHDIHAKFANEIGAKAVFLDNCLIESVKAMPLNTAMLNFATNIRKQGIKTAIFTDNMDVFEKVLVPYHDLTSKFDYIFSSSTYGKLKLEDDAEFLRYAIKEIEVDPQNTLLIDDSPKIGVPIVELGGIFYLYDDYENGFQQFEKWLRSSKLI